MALPPEARRPKTKTRKKAPKKPYTLPKTFRPAVQTDRRPTPKKGPQSPQRTGRPVTKQPVTRKKNAAPTSTDRSSDSSRSPAQKARDRKAVARNVARARRDVVRKRGRAAIPKALAREVVRSAQIGSGQGNFRVRRGRPDLPGATVEQSDRASALGLIPGRAAQGIGRAFYEAPGKTSVNTAKGFRDALTGLPSAVVSSIMDPKGAAKDQLKDYGRRYGPLTKVGGKGVKEFTERIKKEGAAAEALDVSTLASGTGAAVGRGLGKAAKAGTLGAKAERIATEPRKRARVTGGKSEPQRLSDNLLVAARQKRLDEKRSTKQAKKVRKADEKESTIDALTKEAVERGEVVPRRAKRTQRRMYAREKGRDLQRMKREQHREVDKGTRRQLSKLSKDERLAFKYAMQLGLPADPVRARAHLKTRLDKIVGARGVEGVEVPKTRRKTNDEVRAIRHLIDRSEGAFTPRLRETVKGEERRNRRIATSDPGLAPEQIQLRRYAAQAAHLGVKRKDGESNGQFLRRVKKAAKAKGLERPGYFPSEKRAGAGYGGRTIGGTKAVVDPKAYTGALFRTGREDVRPEVFAQALDRSIKRKYNWNLVAKTFDRHSFEWGRNRSVKELLDELDNRGIDPESVALWNPRKYREERQGFDAGMEVERTGRGDEPAAQGVDKAVDASAVTIKDLATKPEDFKSTEGWSVVPREVYDEIHADTRPSGVVGRSLDIAKGKQARILLGLSPTWLQYQVASNALLTGLAGTGPVDFVKAQVWWKRLPEKERDAIEPYIGVGTFQDAVQQTKLGAAKTRSNGLNHLADAYRGFKQTPFMQKVGKGNPLDALFRVDNAQNNAFRRSVLYSQVKRDAYKRMGENANRMMERQRHILQLAKLGPEDQMRAVIRDQEALEKHAEHVNDFLGDYVTYTAKERRVLGRSVMFYGFLRYSLRFAFYTMPVKHPVMTSILAQMGRLQTEEVRKILGGDELPWALGKLYFTKDGKLKSVDLSRANPASNAITNLRAPKDVLGFLPPVFVAAFDQAYSKTSFRNRDFRVEGENQGRRDGKYGVENRARIFLDQMLSLASPYRIAEKATQAGPQGDDSLLFSQRPTKYKRADIVKSIAKQEAERPKGIAARALRELTPLVPREDKAPEIAASIRARNIAEHPKKKKGSGAVDWSAAAKGGSAAPQVDWSKVP